MKQVLNFLAGLCHVLTILGSAFAALVLFESVDNIADSGRPDFSSVIALSFVIIPYCLAKAFQGLAAMVEVNDQMDAEVAECPACLGMVPFSASICRHCRSELIPMSE